MILSFAGFCRAAAGKPKTFSVLCKPYRIQRVFRLLTVFRVSVRQSCTVILPKLYCSCYARPQLQKAPEENKLRGLIHYYKKPCTKGSSIRQLTA